MSEITIGDVSVSAQAVVDAIEDSGFYEDGSIEYAELETSGTQITNAGECGSVAVVPDFSNYYWAKLDVTHHDGSEWVNVKELYDDATEALADAEPEWVSEYERQFYDATFDTEHNRGWQVVAVAKVSSGHGSEWIAGLPDEAELEYVNNPMVANDGKEYYGLNVPDESVVLFFSDSRFDG